MANICVKCAIFPFCKEIEENKKECNSYEKVQKKLIKKEDKIIMFENI